MSDCIFPSTKQPLDNYVRAWRDGTMVVAHRVAWERVHGPIPEGMDLHHTCHARACINVEHLELLDHGEHSRLHNAAVTHCPQGHEYTPENTHVKIVRGYPCRNCRQCDRDRHHRWYREVGRARRGVKRIYVP